MQQKKSDNSLSGVDQDAERKTGHDHQQLPQLRVAFHPPCSLQHGQKLSGQIESLLAELGFTLTAFDDAQECCGSAGTYSIFQPKISSTLKAKKIANLQKSSPHVIATANIGCQLHLQSVTDTPVIHWVELLGAALPAQVS